jgi:hypothetical protein
MGNYEGFRLANQKERSSALSAAMRRGISRSGATIEIRSPRHFPEMSSPVVTEFHLWPCSTCPCPTSPLGLANNFNAVNSNRTDKDQINVRVDFTESSKSSWYGRYGWTDEGSSPGDFQRRTGHQRAAGTHQHAGPQRKPRE